MIFRNKLKDRLLYKPVLIIVMCWNYMDISGITTMYTWYYSMLHKANCSTSYKKIEQFLNHKSVS
jgi:hypothetical protein